MAHKMSRTSNVEQVVERANEPFYDDFYTPKNWFRSADALVKQASVYEHEGDLQTAYFLLFRHARLILEFLPKHADAKDPQYSQAWKDARQVAGRSLAKMEALKPRINKRYERNQEKVKAERLARKKSQDSVTHSGSSSRRDSMQERYQLDATEHTDVAVELARKELGSHAFAVPMRNSSRYDDSDGSHDLRTALLDTGRLMSRRSPRSRTTTPSVAREPSTSSNTYSYPSVSAPHAIPRNDYSRSPDIISSRTSSLQPPLRPDPPPKSPLQPLQMSPPPLPFKNPPIPAKSSPHPASTPSRPTTPTATPSFAHTSRLENGTALRPIFLPTTLRDHFLAHAASNTRANLETLGLLCGNLLRNAFFITKVLLPPQEATSDTCEMTEFGETVLDRYISAHSLPDREPSDTAPNGIGNGIAVSSSASINGAQAANVTGQRSSTPPPKPTADLLILGWIHTHPTQTCFLSSRDLHTHVWYQSTLPESIALVCAPSKPHPDDFGGFRLTDPPGMVVIRGCRRPGVFHLHEEGEGKGIYTDVVGGLGHVVVVEGMGCSVVDLRGEVEGDGG